MLLFVRQFLKHKRQIGSIWPSSPPLATALTKYLKQPRGPRRVLEVGPGTGPVTKRILDALREGDEFHAVEINQRFCDELEKAHLAPFRGRNPGVAVHLHCAAVETAPLDGEFDSIICGIPFNNFPASQVRAIFRRLLDLLAPRGELVYYEYAGVRAVKSQFVDAAGRRRLKQLGATVKVLRRRHAGKRELVLGNIPPAFATRLTRSA
jgi:phosphatidylethanolamine/phosphatidyl-N-methylethanolamine N-methyltransferase